MSAFALALGFYGVHRALRTGLTKALIAAPALMWLVGHLWEFVPERVVDRVTQLSPLVQAAPANLGMTVFLVALTSMAVAARSRLGAGLSTATLVALGVALFFRIVPSTYLRADPGPVQLLVLRTEAGWSSVALHLSALCMVATGVGAVAVPPLPRRVGAVAGVAGALLLSAGVTGLQSGSARASAREMVGLGLVWLVGNTLVAVGLGAMARAGAKVAGWIGVGLVVLGILGLIPALALFENTDRNAYGFLMSMPFALLGIGVALFGWNGAPFEAARKVLGGLFVAAFAGGAIAWLATYIALARVVNAREPWGLARLTTEPLASLGLVLWAALLLYLAFPPRAPQITPLARAPGAAARAP